ncbi:MAG: zinc ribbon domain-containing protein [Phycisphaerales bacterium]
MLYSLHEYREPNPDSKYKQAKSTLRIFGPTLLVIGIFLSLIGVGSFIMGFIGAVSGNIDPGDSKFPILFLLAIPGFLCLGIGGMMTQAGYLKEITQYAAKETTPAVTTTTTAIRSAITDDDIPCPSCSEPIEPDSKFCAHCGIQIGQLLCPTCKAPLEANDRFCNQCGGLIGEQA